MYIITITEASKINFTNKPCISMNSVCSGIGTVGIDIKGSKSSKVVYQ